MDLAARLRAKAPDYIVAGLDPNFFVTEAHVRCCSGTLKGRTLYVSLPMCHIMTLPEFEAVLAHELAHYKGFDTRFSGIFYPVYTRAAYALGSLGSESEGLPGSVALLPARFIIQTFLESFATAESRVSRGRELAADKVASETTGPRHVATALLKLQAFWRQWKRVAGTLRQSRTVPSGSNASVIFKDLVLEASRPSALEDLEDQEPPHPTDRHPPLSVRLRALDQGVEDLVTWALVTAPSEPAINLVANPAALEEPLTQLEDWWRF
jgi:Zn-dependent protease with chaperone function